MAGLVNSSCNTIRGSYKIYPYQIIYGDACWVGQSFHTREAKAFFCVVLKPELVPLENQIVGSSYCRDNTPLDLAP